MDDDVVVVDVEVVGGSPLINVPNTSRTMSSMMSPASVDDDLTARRRPRTPPRSPTRRGATAAHTTGARRRQRSTGPTKSPPMSGSSTHVGRPTPKRRATRSKSSPTSSNGPMSRANKSNPTSPEAGGAATQRTTATRSPTSDCSCESKAVYAYHGATDTGTPSTASTTCSGVASGHGGPAGGVAEPGGNGGFVGDVLGELRSGLVDVEIGLGSGRSRSGGRPPDGAEHGDGDRHRDCASPARQQTSVSHRQMPSVPRVRGPATPIGSIPLRTWKSTTAASVNGP